MSEPRPPRVRSKCINCGKHRSCIKIEARCPLPYTVLVPVCNDTASWHEQHDYEPAGPMVEICRQCLRDDRGTLAHFLVEGLKPWTR